MNELKAVEMTGSEKQIAWATDIVTRPYTMILADAKMYREIGQNERAEILEKAAEIYADTYRKASANPKMASASWVIDNKHQFGTVSDAAIMQAIKGTSYKRCDFRPSYTR